MAKKITFLGIETSCDETAAAVIRENDEGTADILSNIVSSQIEEHKKFGGVVPELAARAHLENIEFIIDTALKQSKVSIDEVDGVAATAGPGLIVCLTVGLNIGKSIAAFSDKPFITLVISSPTFSNSFKSKPLVVAAWEPNLIPEVIMGFSVSNGIPFLLQVIFALHKLSEAKLPFTLKGLKSTNIKWVSVPPE